MVRRVGFGNSEDEKKSVADEYADRFRRKAAVQDRIPKLRAKRQWFPIVFLCVWLTLWTAGMMTVVVTIFFGTGPTLFLFVWLAFAAFGWFAALKALIKLFKGTQVIDE